MIVLLKILIIIKINTKSIYIQFQMFVFMACF